MPGAVGSMYVPLNLVSKINFCMINTIMIIFIGNVVNINSVPIVIPNFHHELTALIDYARTQ